MAKGLEKHQEKMAALNAFAKDLVRRSGSQCELCESTGRALSIYSIPPVSPTPDIDHLLFLCETCSEQLDNPRRLDPNHWQFLRSAIWSEMAQIQVVGLRVLRKIEDRADWARETLEAVDLDDSVIEWANRAPL